MKETLQPLGRLGSPRGGTNSVPDGSTGDDTKTRCGTTRPSFRRRSHSVGTTLFVLQQKHSNGNLHLGANFGVVKGFHVGQRGRASSHESPSFLLMYLYASQPTSAFVTRCAGLKEDGLVVPRPDHGRGMC